MEEYFGETTFRQKWEEAKAKAPTRLPEPEKYFEFEATLVEKPKSIVENLLDSSSRMVFGGSSKTYKTWAMSDLALSIATGVPWWIFKCFSFPVLYVNLELKPYYARERFRAIRLAKEIHKAPGNMWIWNLRDYNISNSFDSFREQAVEFILKYSIAVIFLDPFYKLLGERDERVSAELIPILTVFEQIAKASEASTVTSVHFVKGNTASRDPIDRMSGGGVINRHPDGLVTLSKHDVDGSFIVDVITRDFPPVESFVATWNYPLLVPDKTLDPRDIKMPKTGRPRQYSVNDILEVLRAHDDEFSTSELQECVQEEIGISRGAFYALFKELKESKKIFRSQISKKWNISAKSNK